MSGNMYLDHYLDGIETLPFELQRNFTLMKELDQRAQDLLKEIDNMSDKYVAEVRKMDALQRTDHLKKIENAFSKSKEYVDDKVQLAMQTYEMVDKHIRKLDHDLARFEADLKEERAKEAGLSSDYENDPTPPKNVSYGEMIGCDNMECPIEWFHFPCVGLVAKPKGKWYCPKCSQDRKKK
ncbi:predicted protein [Nematostella vectensis]|uniref:Inhibitor of growth protein n=1 Tax=Nematostella vectensis TaxID=45351 RepID=A7SFP0_NEMVE|nr:predicted protein [Nematostella vectensis]|eukprot:XP_001629595.1 predicted protein [Nematostella vectensis]